MNNETINSILTEQDFFDFITSKFDQPIPAPNFPKHYLDSRVPDSFLAKLDKQEVQNIHRVERIRDYIFVNYGIDIYKKPCVVYFESESEKLEGFMNSASAQSFCKELLNSGTCSLLIMIMNEPMAYEKFI